MRTYLIDNDKNEYIIDLAKTIVHSSELVEFEFSTVKDNSFVNKERIYVRRLGGQYFSSMDGARWSKLARQDSPNRMLNVDTVFNLFRGYKPSSLASGAEGELLTQMPGKIVKIFVEVGSEVKKGETLLILEAMKMENEIKSPIDGVVKAIGVSEGDALDSGVMLMEVLPKDE